MPLLPQVPPFWHGSVALHGPGQRASTREPQLVAVYLPPETYASRRLCRCLRFVALLTYCLQVIVIIRAALGQRDDMVTHACIFAVESHNPNLPAFLVYLAEIAIPLEYPLSASAPRPATTS